MNYYRLRYSIDKRIVGTFPQVEDAVYTCDIVEDPLFIGKYNFENAPENVKVANAILVKKAELTDVISASIMGFSGKLLISVKLKKIIETTNCTDLQFFKSPIYFRDVKIDDYYTLNPTKNNLDYLDFEKCEIYLMKNVFNKLETLNFKSYSEFEDYRRSLVKGSGLSLYIENYQLDLSKIKKDIFVLVHVEAGFQYIISDKLKHEILEKDISGIEFIKVC